jgi:anti-sigma factor RsiW
MHCDEIDRRLDRYMEGDLRTTERLCVDVHLAQCYTCRQTLAAYGELNAAVGDILQHPEPSNDFDTLLARIRTSEAAAGRRDAVEHAGEPLGRRFAIAAGVLVVAGLSAAWIERDTPRRGAGAPTAPAAIQSLSERTDRMIEDAETGSPEPARRNVTPGTSDGNAPF